MDELDNIILTDVDGVLLNWEKTFMNWMSQKKFEVKCPGHFDDHGICIEKMYDITPERRDELIHFFNESVFIRHLPPIRNAMKYVRALHEEHGFVFHAITSFTSEALSMEARKENLADLFGKTAVQKLISLPIRGCKKESLKQYVTGGLFFVEDRIANAVLAQELGLNPIILKHNYNAHYTGTIPMLSCWKEIYQYIAYGELPSG